MSFTDTAEDKAFDQLVVDIVDRIKTPHSKNDDRNKSIFLGFHGAGGGEGTTLDDQGRRHGGLTRECVRQVVANIQAQIYLSEKEKSWVKRMLSIVTSSAPCSLDDLTENLKNEGFLSVEIDNPQGLINLGFVMAREKSKVKFQNVGDKFFVLPVEKKGLINKIRTETQKTVGKYGACSVAGICVRSGISTGKVNKQFVASVLECMDSVTFLSEDWLTCNPGYKDRMTKRIERVFSVYQSVELNTLYHVMARSLRQIKETVERSPEFKAFGFGNLKDLNESRKKAGKKPLNRTPYVDESEMRMAFDVSIFKKLVERYEGLEIQEKDGLDYVVANERLSPEESPTEVMVKILNLLESEKDKSLRESDIREKADLNQKELYTFITAGNFSPYISRVRRGTYKTLGVMF